MSLFNNIFEEDKLSQEPRMVVTGPILAVDIGSIHTRAVLIDVVEGMYRFIARSETPTTAVEPWNDVMVGVIQALEDITAATGRQLLDSSYDLILPEEGEFVGVDLFVATASAGKPIRAVLLGLMPDISLESGKRAADSIFLSLVDSVSLADKRTTEEQLDALLKADADLMLVVGGTDNGAVVSMQKYFDTIMLAYSLMDPTARPPLLFAGNKALADEIVERAQETGIQVFDAANVRPTLDEEYLDSAQAELAALYHQQKVKNTPGFADVGSWTQKGIFPTTHGFGRLLHLLGGLKHQNVLGIDLGSTGTTIGAYVEQQRYLNVFGHLGMGHSAEGLLEHARPESLMRWLSCDATEDDIINYVRNKSIYPHTIPASHQDLEIEFAMAREIVRRATWSARQSWRGVQHRGLFPHFDTIILSGAALTHTPSDGWSALLALDALLPVGITRLLLDPYGMASALGTIAPTSPEAVIQVLETGAFRDLGTVISVSGVARRGDVVLAGSLKPKGAAKVKEFKAQAGTITTLPLAYGQEAELILRPRRADIGGLGRRQKLNITGGELGVIIDTRGRPWRFPRGASKRQALMRMWQEAIT